ncbi:MAG TPA: serine/threonine protein kinase [Polyangiaceae bacterium]|nr:serine/threonine protein kinase [Polyangiaceae bacterium]
MMQKAIAAVLAWAAIGCGPSFEASTPQGFVELEDQEHFDYRATTADGLVIAVRELEHEPKGAPDFWIRAIENQMRQRGGYAMLGSHDVSTKTGLKGKQLRFGHDEGETPYLYVLTLFVTDDQLYLMEFGGTKELVERHKDQLEWAVQNFRGK